MKVYDKDTRSKGIIQDGSSEYRSQKPLKQQQQFLVKDSIFAPDLPEYQRKSE
jgi:hypothetical protein